MRAAKWKSGLVFFVLALVASTLAGALRSEANAGAWLSTYPLSGDPANGSSELVVKITKKKNKGNKCAREHSCPAGYVVLDKPNKYGACCEPKEGLPAPAPAEAEKCKLGMIGTPPNDCHCPEGMEFVGYKGCVKVEMKEKCVVYAWGQTQEERNRLDQEWAQIRASCPKEAPPAGCTGGISPNSTANCCCKYKVYEK
jgi:hypothetical protein